MGSKQQLLLWLTVGNTGRRKNGERRGLTLQIFISIPSFTPRQKRERPPDLTGMESFLARKRSPTTTKVHSSPFCPPSLDLTPPSGLLSLSPDAFYPLDYATLVIGSRVPHMVVGEDRFVERFSPLVSSPSVPPSLTQFLSYSSSGFTRASISTLIWQIISQRVSTT